MVNTASVIALCVGIFSLTLRYTGWFHVQNVWLITVAAALLQVWALLSLAFCGTTIGELFVIIASTLLALISHGYRTKNDSSAGRFQEIVRRRIELNTILCAFYLSIDLKDKNSDTCEQISIIFLAGVILMLVLDHYLQTQNFYNENEGISFKSFI